MPPRTKPSEGASSCEGPSLPSAIPDADSEHTASVPVQPIRVHSGCRTVDTQNRPANGRQPGTPGTQLRWQTVTGTRSGSSEMLGVPRPYTTPCGLLKQPDKQSRLVSFDPAPATASAQSPHRSIRPQRLSSSTPTRLANTTIRAAAIRLAQSLKASGPRWKTELALLLFQRHGSHPYRYWAAKDRRRDPCR